MAEKISAEAITVGEYKEALEFAKEFIHFDPSSLLSIEDVYQKWSDVGKFLSDITVSEGRLVKIPDLAEKELSQAGIVIPAATTNFWELTLRTDKHRGRCFMFRGDSIYLVIENEEHRTLFYLPRGNKFQPVCKQYKLGRETKFDSTLDNLRILTGWLKLHVRNLLPKLTEPVRLSEKWDIST